MNPDPDLELSAGEMPRWSSHLHTGSGLYNHLQHPTLCPTASHIRSTTFLQHSTTLYSLQLYIDSSSTVYKCGSALDLDAQQA